MAVVAGNQGFLAVGDWLKSYQADLIDIFQVDHKRLPSYSTIRRVMLPTDYSQYSQRLTQFFVAVSPKEGETVVVDDKVL